MSAVSASPNWSPGSTPWSATTGMTGKPRARAWTSTICSKSRNALRRRQADKGTHHDPSGRHAGRPRLGGPRLCDGRRRFRRAAPAGRMDHHRRRGPGVHAHRLDPPFPGAAGVRPAKGRGSRAPGPGRLPGGVGRPGSPARQGPGARAS